PWPCADPSDPDGTGSGASGSDGSGPLRSASSPSVVAVGGPVGGGGATWSASSVPHSPEWSWAAADTAAPWPGPGGVACATRETRCPWVSHGAADGAAVAGIV